MYAPVCNGFSWAIAVNSNTSKTMDVNVQSLILCHNGVFGSTSRYAHSIDNLSARYNGMF